MPRRSLTLLLALTFAVSASAEKARKPVPPLPANEYPYHQVDEANHVTIAAEPCTTKETLPNFRLKYLDHGFLPVRVIDDSDLAINLDDARIHFIAADGSSIPAATDDDLQRGMFTIKSATGSKTPLPLPFPIPISHGKTNINKDIISDDNDFGFQTTTVQPHTTVAGYLFYDTNNLDQPVLDHATLELRKVRLMLNNKALDSFEIPLSKKTGEADKPTPEAKP